MKKGVDGSRGVCYTGCVMRNFLIYYRPDVHQGRENTKGLAFNYSVEVEEQFRALVDEMSANTVLQVKLEDNLLAELSASSGNILDNDELIATLNDTRTKATEIAQTSQDAPPVIG